MSQPQKICRWAHKSPWFDPAFGNLFLDEFRIAEEKLAGGYFQPIDVFSQICLLNGEALFFKGLASFTPMFPVIAYHGQIASWTSPPPSGFGNAIYMVIGRDNTGRLRLVGGNIFTEPTYQSGTPFVDAVFFDQYDRADDRGKQRLVHDAVAQSICLEHKSLLRDVSRECEHFHTMGVYITVLSPEGSFFHAAKAVIEGEKPADFAYENFGEIK